MSHPNTHVIGERPAQALIDLLGDATDRALVIVGNGPSSAVPRYDLLPADPVVFRMNWFFLEDRYHFGRRVDLFFASIPQSEMEYQLAEMIRQDVYEVAATCAPMKWPLGRDAEAYRSGLHDVHVDHLDHWSLIAQEPALARFMMSRPLPTQGMQAVATGLLLGFTDITLCGVDMYGSADRRYGYVVPDDVARALDAKDLQPGYEDRHSLDRDLDFLDAALAVRPEARVHYIGPSEHLTARLLDPPLRPEPCTFGGVSARDVQAMPKRSLRSEPPLDPRIGDPGPLVLGEASPLPSAEIDGRRCGFVTLVSGNFHHGARALAHSLAAVSDVPLLVMATPSADRHALSRSGIAYIDVPEILNPNQLAAATARFAATYSKLHAFRLTHLDRAIYVDADMIVLRSIDDLFDREGFCAVPDHGLEHHYRRFNSGLFAYKPDDATFVRMLSRVAEVASYDGGDQGFLNEFFSDWTVLDHEYNVNKRWSDQHPNLFRPETARVIHFVGPKPWQLEPRSQFDQLYELWFRQLERDELVELGLDMRTLGGPVQAHRRRSTSLGDVRRRLATARSTIDPASLNGSLLRRVQRLIDHGQYDLARALIDAEWPGDSAAGPGLRRERAKLALFAGDTAGSLAELEAILHRHPTSGATVTSLQHARRLAQIERASFGLVPAGLLARWLTRVRQLVR